MIIAFNVEVFALNIVYLLGNKGQVTVPTVFKLLDFGTFFIYNSVVK